MLVDRDLIYVLMSILERQQSIGSRWQTNTKGKMVLQTLIVG
jgi:hypothetical protein